MAAVNYSEFDLRRYQYHLPDELIAQHPCRDRDGAKLLALSAEGSIEDTYIEHLADYLKPGDLLVLNNSQVLPMRIYAHKHINKGQRGGKIEILISRIIDGQHALAMLRASRSPRAGDNFILGESDYLAAADKNEADGDMPTYVLKSEGKSIYDLCEQYGHTPLPPYIKRAADENDKARYQTIYAKQGDLNGGSAAAPTAGLHLSKRLLAKIKAQAVEVCELTLHVGLGTFAPIRSNDIRQHKMHAEYCQLPQELAIRLNQAKQRGRRIVAVGTTSLRVLESFYDDSHGKFSAGAKDTNIFIYPGGKKPMSADLLLTNFHQPSSSLLLLVCAFSGYDNIMAAYEHAVKGGYRFLSYGDACLLQRRDAGQSP